MNQIAIIDTETTGVDPTTDRLLEVAIATVDLETGRLIDAGSRLVWSLSKNESEAVNGIPTPLLRHGYERAVVFDWLRSEVVESDYIVAHNADFDRAWLPDIGKPWVCSCDDIQWPKQAGSRSLTALALAHGIGVVYAHRALADVLTLAHMFERVHEMGIDLHEMLAKATRPKAMFEALVSFSDRNKAKEAGFRWEPETKRWLRKLFLEDVPTLGFRVKEVSVG